MSVVRLLPALVPGVLLSPALAGVPSAPVPVVQNTVHAASGSAVWAVTEASRLGRTVAVPAEMGETRDVFANPDGTFTAKMRIMPVRVRRGSGWVPINTTLRQNADGSVGPVATSKPVVFSGGGLQPLVRLYDGTTQVELRWPAPLPKPSLSKDSATYAEVLPGVDLRMRATAQGFSKVLVVKNRAAARNPGLAEVRFGLTARGLTARSDRHGNISFRDGKGGTAFVTGAALMSDSGGRQSVGRLRLDEREVVLTPDRKMLTDPATRFPVFIDPDVISGRTGFGLVLSGYPNNAFWGGDFEHIAKVGLCPESLNPVFECGSPHIGVARSFFAFDSSFLLGRRVLKAEFNTFLAYTPSCVGGQVQVWGTNPIDAGLTWNNQPFPGGGPSFLGSDHVAGGYNATCPGRSYGYDATTAVVNSLTFSQGRTAIMLKAGDEGQEHGWKKYIVNSDTPYLTVTFNSYPDQPTGLTVEGKPCAQAPNEPYVNPFLDNDPAKGPRGPQLAARITDWDDGSLYGHFEWRTRGGATLGGATTAVKSSGSTFSVDIPAAHAADGAKLSYRVRGANDLVVGGINYGTDFGPWAPSNTTWCDITIDRTAPGVAPTVTSADYPKCGFETCPTGGGIGRTGTFALGRNGVADVAGFRFDLHDQPSTFVAASADGTAAALVTPPDDGPMDLFVRSVDKAGNVGPIARYHFWVGPGTPPKGHWRLNGLDETAVLDDSSGHHDGTISLSSASWRTGRHGDALWLNGTGNAFVGTANGRTIRTDQSFAVAAWVKIDRTDAGWRTAVSQDGGPISGFFLQFNPNTRKWNFMMPAASDNAAARRIAESVAPAVAGRWTHLVGVYDAATRQVRIYVDGVAGTPGSHTTPWDASGTVQLGRARYNSGPVDNWLGMLDDVRVYDRVLSIEEIQALATTPAVEDLFLPLEEGAGTGTIDASGNYHHGAFSSGTSWVPGRVGSAAVGLDGTTGAITLNSAGVRTDNSFTLTAMVKLDSTDAKWQTVVSQDGPLSSGFALQYTPNTKKWVLALSPQDGNAPAWMTVESAGLAQAGEWTHLAGVYDTSRGELRLYVNGALSGTRAGRALTNVPGPVLVGRAKQGSQGGAVAYLRGSVDDVHVWSGVRTQDQIRQEFLNPVTKRSSAYTGQLSRYSNSAGGHVVTTEAVPPGSHFEGSMGLMAPAGTADTVTIYSCRNGATDYFLARGSCGGPLQLGSVGSLYNSPPAGIQTQAVYSCAIGSSSHFASHDPNCEGAAVVGRLGYSLAYAKLIRSVSAANDDHITSTFRVPGHYRPEGSLGMVSGPRLPGTTALWICREGTDSFVSNQSDCEGKTVVQWIGHIWTTPPTNVTGAAELLRCRGTDGERWESLDPGCEGRIVDRSLGYVVTEL